MDEEQEEQLLEDVNLTQSICFSQRPFEPIHGFHDQNQSTSAILQNSSFDGKPDQSLLDQDFPFSIPTVPAKCGIKECGWSSPSSFSAAKESRTSLKRGQELPQTIRQVGKLWDDLDGMDDDLYKFNYAGLLNRCRSKIQQITNFALAEEYCRTQHIRKQLTKIMVELSCVLAQFNNQKSFLLAHIREMKNNNDFLQKHVLDLCSLLEVKNSQRPADVYEFDSLELSNSIASWSAPKSLSHSPSFGVIAVAGQCIPESEESSIWKAIKDERRLRGVKECSDESSLEIYLPESDESVSGTFLLEMENSRIATLQNIRGSSERELALMHYISCTTLLFLGTLINDPVASKCVRAADFLVALAAVHDSFQPAQLRKDYFEELRSLVKDVAELLEAKPDRNGSK